MKKSNVWAIIRATGRAGRRARQPCATGVSPYSPGDFFNRLQALTGGPQPMVPKKPVPDLIRDGNRFSDKTMRK